MKQIFVLSPEEIKDLVSGEPLRITLGGQELVFQAERPKKIYGPYKKDQSLPMIKDKTTGTGRNQIKPGQTFACKESGCEELEPFVRKQDWGRHMSMEHRDKWIPVNPIKAKQVEAQRARAKSKLKAA